MQSRKDYQNEQKQQKKKTPPQEVNGVWLDQDGKPMLRQPNMHWWENLKFQFKYRQRERPMSNHHFKIPLLDRIKFAYWDNGGLPAVIFMYITLLVIIGIEGHAIQASYAAHAGISKIIAGEFGGGSPFDPRWLQGLFDWSFFKTVPASNRATAVLAVIYWVGMFIFFPFMLTFFKWYFNVLHVLSGMLIPMSFLVFVPIIGWAILIIAWAAFIAGAWIALCLMIEAGPFIGLGVFIKKITYDYSRY